MQITIAGGCGDFGRSCFFVEGERHAFIVDAGTSTDGMDTLPDLTAEQVQRAKYIFITHAHRDHTGAIEAFEEMGFTGPVLLSQQAYRQIHYKPENTLILDSSAPELALEPDFGFRWGRTGHCAGAVWYAMECENKKLFFSGDYREGDPFYLSDPVRNLSADVAVLDAAYDSRSDGEAMRAGVMARVGEILSEGRALLLPVPHYGRGLSMAVLLHEISPETVIHMTPSLYDEWVRLGHRKFFAREEVREMPFDTFREWTEEGVNEGEVYFLTDAQLARAKSKALADRYPEMAILLTGSVHGYGRAKEYLEAGRAELILWPNHMTKREMEALAGANHFKKVIPFHNPKEKPDSLTYIF